MKYLIIITIILAQAAKAQMSAETPTILYGAIEEKQLLQAPYQKWYDSTFKAYQPDHVVIEHLKKTGNQDLSFDIFLGTWCGDSRREVPRFMKLLAELSISSNRIRIIALGGGDSLVKQSPQHEEKGRGIFRVPVFIVYKKGKELGRINEFPVISLEKDLLDILKGQPYSANYRSFKWINEWLIDGALLDPNANTRGMALLLKQYVSNESELNSLGHLLTRQGYEKEAIKIFQINTILYHESAICYTSLGEAYSKAGEQEKAAVAFEKALELNKDPLRVKALLKMLYETKGLK